MSDAVLEPLTFLRVAGPVADLPWSTSAERTAIRPLRFRNVGEAERNPSVAATIEETETVEAETTSMPPPPPEVDERAGEIEERIASLAEAEQRLAERERELEAEKARFVEAVREVATTRGALIARTEKDLLELAIGIAETIVGAELELRPEKLVTFVETALGHLGPSTRAVVRMSPAAADVVRSGLGESFEREGVQVRVVADASIEGLGCVISGDSGLVDARVSERLERVREALGDEAHGSASEGEA